MRGFVVLNHARCRYADDHLLFLPPVFTDTGIAVYCDAPERVEYASNLAEQLSVPLIHTTNDRFAYLLTISAQRLELRRTGWRAPGPVYVDFISGPFGYRRAHGGGRRQLLARAVGLRASERPIIIDATAGLGQDAFTLAMLGCRVLMLERSAIVHALLNDALERAKTDSALNAVIAQRLTLRHENASAYLNELADQHGPEVIYLDPMYPERDHSALGKKNLRMLREVVGDDTDAPGLLAAALVKARRRVVVKRPRRAPMLEGPSPTVQIKGKSTRYDIYVIPAADRAAE